MNINALAMAPVHATLVSRGKKGDYLGVLAERWEAGSDARSWRFFMRKDATFETGERITPAAVAASWRRLAAALERRKSEEGLFSRLEGGPAGITVDAESVSLRFRTPFPRLLDTLSFTLYAVVHPSCYDAATGAWLCGRRAVSSGPYRIAAWDEHSVRLALRPEFPRALRHPRAPRGILLDPKLDRAAADAAVGASIDDLSGAGMRYSGGMEATIAYLRCQSWTAPRSVCHDRAVRRALRAAFYEELRRGGVEPTLSFFPPAVPGMQSFAAEPAPAALGAARGARLSFRPSWTFTAAYTRAMERSAARYGLRFEELFIPKAEMVAELVPGRSAYKNDLVVAMTTLEVDAPERAVRDMFSSAEGIRLPDPTGRARAELSDDPLDLQRINEVLWDDAIVWPVQHYGMGLWAKPDVDLSQVNFNVSPPALEWVGWADSAL